jgi:hypothetical protein
MAEFFLGKRFTRPVRKAGEDGSRSRLEYFMRNLKMLAESTRKATKARDYVTSVWVDCPGYVLPKKFREMGLPSLLDDAVRQLEAKNGVSFQVSRLSGLFENMSSESALWRPKTYLGRRRIEQAGQVYGVILSDQLIPITPNSEVPLCVITPPKIALSELAREYSKIFSSYSTADVFEALKPVLRKWSRNIHNQAGRYITTTTYSQRVSDLVSYELMSSAFLGKLLVATGPDHFDPGSYSFPRSNAFELFDHHQAIYKLVAAVLGLEVRDCQYRGLKLVVVPDISIGLTTMEVGNEKIPGSRKKGTREVITISTSNTDNLSDPEHNGGSILEAVQVAKYPIARYRVTGIWVPFVFEDAFRAGAYMQARFHNALLS